MPSKSAQISAEFWMLGINGGAWNSIADVVRRRRSNFSSFLAIAVVQQYESIELVIDWDPGDRPDNQ
jgi:hypothetical protein